MKYIPLDTINALREATNKSVSNFNLNLNRFAEYNEDKFSIKEVDDENAITQIFNGNDILKNSAYFYYNIHQLDYKLEEFCMKPKWRLIVGLGGESVYETSITLHHIYGFPYIPGQALKGIVRNFIIHRYFQSLLSSNKRLAEIEKEIYKDKLFSFIFGNQDKRGEVVFFDALPVTIPKIDKDVINVHYQDYYSDSTNRIPPADYLNPNPILFLTIKETRFAFLLGIKKEKNLEINSEKLKGNLQSEIIKEFNNKTISISEFLKTITIKALSESGVGAKTAVGYGYLQEADIPDSFLNKVNSFKSDEEKLEDEFKKLCDRIEDGDVKSMQEAMEKVKSGAYSKEKIQKIINILKTQVLNEAIYQKLKLLNNHHGLIHIGIELYRLFEREKYSEKIVDEFITRFTKYVHSYGSKNKQQEWKEIIRDNQTEMQEDENKVLNLPSKVSFQNISVILVNIKENKYEFSKIEFERFTENVKKMFNKDRKNKKMKKSKKDQIIKKLDEMLKNLS